MFASLTALFIYVNSKNILDSYEVDIKKIEEREIAYKDSINNLIDENLDLLYFKLENNDDALSYFENDGIDTDAIVPFIKDEIYKLNTVKGEHPLVPYEAVEGKMIINKIRLLNHKWIIADFSDGAFWGELFITYEITKERQLNFKVAESFLYPPQSY